MDTQFDNFLGELIVYIWKGKLLFCADGFTRNVKKTESIAIDSNTKALLEQVALVDVLDGWKDGILTIGTFGFDPIKPFDQPEDSFIFESEEEEEEAENDSVNKDDDLDEDDNIIVEEEEVNPLIFTTFGHNFKDIASAAAAGHVEKGGVPSTPFVGSSNELRFEGSTDSEKGNNRRRTTLADLFSEDSGINYKKTTSVEVEQNAGKKQSARTKNGLSIAKKFIPNVKGDSRPIKKIHQVSDAAFPLAPNLYCKYHLPPTGFQKSKYLLLSNFY